MSGHALQITASIVFGEGGTAETYQGDGWGRPERGYTWAIGHASTLRIPYAAGRGVLLCELRAFAACVPTVPAQRVTILANGVACGGDTLTVDTIFAIPLAGIEPDKAGIVELVLHHPDALAPADHGVSADRRRLALAVRGVRLIWAAPEAACATRRRPPLPVPHPDMLGDMVRGCTGLPPGELMFRFESIGHDCEFGLVQRLVGAEPLGLLRFGGIPPAKLLAGLECAFEGIDDPAQITLLHEDNVGQKQYIVRCERYGMAFHSFIAASAVPENAMRVKMMAHLRFLRRKFAETMVSGESLFVLHHPSCATPPQVRPYLAALRAWGNNALLFVTMDAQPAGSVDRVSENLFRGHIDRHMSGNADNINAPGWLSVCANGYRLWREAGGGMEEGSASF